jgi:peptidyl-prolyl cis-trans isomerase D
MVLQAIRERLTGIIAVFIFGILIIPFAFVGVSSYFTSDNLNNIAVVNEEPIAMNDFTQSFQTYRMQMQRMLGESYDPNAYDSPIVKREHLDSMIDRALVRQVSLEAGLSVADDRLAEEIRNTPGFQVDGVFNPDVYQASLQANAITPLQYENQLRAGMVMNQFPATIAGSSEHSAPYWFPSNCREQNLRLTA